MSDLTFNASEKSKLNGLFNEGMRVLNEIETLQAGYNDTVKAIGEELNVKPALLKKAIRIAYKSKLTDTNRDHEDLNTILETVGRTI